MLLQDRWGILHFLTGYIVGMILVFIMRRFFKTPFYLQKLYAIGKLLLVFIKELILSSIFVIRYVVSPRMTFTPGIFSLKTKLKGDLEITVISLLITLTPGSVVIEVSPDGRFLYVHAMHMTETENSVLKTLHAFENAIMEVTRNV
jgi:multicomponent Na+:H+ antiporter subunit E